MIESLLTSLVILTFSFVAYVVNIRLQNDFLCFIFYTSFSFLGYILTCKLIPTIKAFNLKADLFGYDINKKGTDAGTVKIPESIGIVPATLFLVLNLVGITFLKYYDEKFLFEHTSGLLSICFTVFLGFSDDVLDLPWRYKLILPTIAQLPILVAYSGVTNVIVPIPLRALLGTNYIHLGFLYYIYLGMLAVFCTNSINIYAGINGLEVGQSIIIACSILLLNSIEIFVSTDAQNISQHIVSIIYIVPYIFTTLALFKFNKYPSQVFVGDIFCYWSGMTFAVAGILGHFSKTLLLFFIPQIINFLYSVPQLFKFIPCPRHRLPKYNQETKKLECIKSNLTLINLFLWITGPTTEKQLCQRLLILQIISCGLGFALRYGLAQLVF